MKKLAVIFVIGMILLMTLGIVFAESPKFSEEYNSFIERIKEKKGVKDEDITNITEVNFSALPPEIITENIDDTNLAIYKVDLKGNKSIFVLTSGKKFKGLTKPVYYSKLFLNFGFSGEMSGSGFLKTATGVEGNLEKGYVMMRKGSITGISTNLDIVNENDKGQIEIIIYKNKEEIGFRNTLDAVSSGAKKDYDLQSRDTVTFEPGDVISVYAKVQGDVSWKDVITMVEITIEN